MPQPERLDRMEALVRNDWFASAAARDVVAWSLRRFSPRRVAVVTSLQAAGMAIVDMAVRRNPQVRIITVDSGRLPEETQVYLDTIREHYGVDIEVVFPHAQRLQNFVSAHGANPFRQSVEMRAACCEVRKVEPLQEALRDVDCWMTGLRRDQSSSRSTTPVLEIDHAHGGIAKLAPLARWTEHQARTYLVNQGVPLHPLYDEGYRSIGCAPCTRAVEAGGDERSGRWWWEQGALKECGIHRSALDGPAAGAVA